MECNYLPIITREYSTRVKVNDVMTISRNSRKLEIKAENGVFSYYEKIENILDCLDERFFRCNNGFLLNLEKVEVMKNQKVIFSNGEEIEMPRDAFLRAKKAYKDYLRNMFVNYIRARKLSNQ